MGTPIRPVSNKDTKTFPQETPKVPGHDKLKDIAQETLSGEHDILLDVDPQDRQVNASLILETSQGPIYVKFVKALSDLEFLSWVNN